jgi:hypothetical protein
MKKQNYPHPERLKKLALWLDELKIGLQIEILVDSSNSFNDELAINLMPIFITPIKNFPKIFENEWEISEDGEMTWREDKFKTTLSSIHNFFGINSEMLMHIFAPYAQSNYKFGGKILKNNACSKDMAFNIKELVKINNSALKLHPDINIFISKN